MSRTLPRCSSGKLCRVVSNNATSSLIALSPRTLPFLAGLPFLALKRLLDFQCELQRDFSGFIKDCKMPHFTSGARGKLAVQVQFYVGMPQHSLPFRLSLTP